MFCVYLHQLKFVMPFVGHKNSVRNLNPNVHSSVTRKSQNLINQLGPHSEGKTSADFVYVLMRSDARNLTSMGCLRRENNRKAGILNPLNLATFKRLKKCFWFSSNSVLSPSLEPLSELSDWAPFCGLCRCRCCSTLCGSETATEDEIFNLNFVFEIVPQSRNLWDGARWFRLF